MSDETKLVMGQPHSSNMVDGTHVAWLVRPTTEWEVDSYVYFGMTGGGGTHLSGKLTVDDAEAIGYSLLYAVKLQRDKEEARDD
jgi:hypothetical protein